MAAVPTAPITENVLAAIRARMGEVRTPSGSDKVFRECAFSFDTPFSPGGLYTNLSTFASVGRAFLPLDRSRSGSHVYLHDSWRRVPHVPTDAELAADAAADPSVFVLKSSAAAVDVIKSSTIVVFLTDDAASDTCVTAALPDDALPTVIAVAVQALRDRADASTVAEAASAWEDTAAPSKYAASLAQVASGLRVSPRAEDWICGSCDKRDNLWLNLSDGFIGCGRRNWDGTGGYGHALEHFNDSGGLYPLCVKLGTITSSGGDVYSYAPDENDMVVDPHLAVHLAHWGISIMQLEKTEKTMAELNLELNKSYDFGRITEAGKELVPASGPGFIGLENLGNSCYMNSVMQVLATVPEARAMYAAPEVVRRVTDTAGAPRVLPDDMLLQTSKVFNYLYSGQYAMIPEHLRYRVAKERAAASGLHKDASAIAAAAATASGLPVTFVEPTAGDSCGYIVPRAFRAIMGKGHSDFSTAKQQDAQQYLDWVFSQLEKAGAAGRDRLGAAGSLADLFTFATETRVLDTQSGMVRYKAGSERFLRLNIPVDSATNTAEVAAATAAAQAEAEATVAARESGAAVPTSTVSQEGKTALTAEDVGPHKRPRTDLPHAADRDAVVRLARSLTMEKVPRLIVPFEACMEALRSPGMVEDFRSPVTGARGVAVTQTRIASAPRYLVVQMNRYTLAADWSTVKIDAAVRLPEVLDLDAAGMRAQGPQPGETMLPAEDAAPVGSAAAAAAAVVPDDALVAQLESMSFPRGACCRAAVATKNSGMEAAMEWILSHMEDADFGEEYTPVAASPAPAAAAPAAAVTLDEGAIAMLMDMGFPRDRVEHALRETGGNAERGADWLFSHMDEPLPSASAAAPALVAAPAATHNEADAAAPAKYAVVAIISHLGSNTSSGHYVCHIRKHPHTGDLCTEEGVAKWYFFNDEKVAESVEPPLEFGFLYLYKRVA